MSTYWPWWAGSVALGVLPVAYWLVLRRPFGVSGLFGRLVSVQDELKLARDNAAAPTTQADVDALLAAATFEQFGCPMEGEPVAAASPPPGTRALGPRLGMVDAAVFLAALAMGGLISRLTSAASVGPGMGEAFAHAFGRGAPALGVLLLGGALVGAGTTLADGCSTGHGLTGSARLQLGSLLATACFMASAVGVSLLVGLWVGP
jgi:uncharacterized protein